MRNILFVDDDIEFRDVIAEYLELENFSVIVADNAAAGLRLFKQHQFDLVISDVKMVSIDGLQFLSLIRSIDETAKVILLTGSNNDDDEVRGLQLEVNDFIKKPVSMKVLLTRIDRVLNSKVEGKKQNLVSETQNLEINVQTRKVYKNNELIELTTRELDVLIYLMKNKGSVLSRETIFRQVWKMDETFSDIRTVDTHVKKLRAKLKLSCIYSIRGVGYEWAE